MAAPAAKSGRPARAACASSRGGASRTIIVSRSPRLACGVALRRLIFTHISCWTRGLFWIGQLIVFKRFTRIICKHEPQRGSTPQPRVPFFGTLGSWKPKPPVPWKGTTKTNGVPKNTLAADPLRRVQPLQGCFYWPFIFTQGFAFAQPRAVLSDAFSVNCCDCPARVQQKMWHMVSPQ